MVQALRLREFRGLAPKFEFGGQPPKSNDHGVNAVLQPKLKFYVGISTMIT